MEDIFDFGTCNSEDTKQQSDHILIVDGSNILFKLTSVFEPKKNETQNDDFLTRLERDLLLQTDGDNDVFAKHLEDEKYLSFKRNLFKSFLTKINMHYKAFNCTKVYLIFDVGTSWRVSYTKGEFENITPITNRIYKSNRRKDMTAQQILAYKMMKQVCSEIISFFEQHTNVKCFYKPLLEADDIISHLPVLEKHNTFVILSADGDLAQLQRFENVQVYDAHNNKMRDKIDVKWFLFEKCIRGDKSDYVRSAFPRVKTTRLEKAFIDPFEYVNIMETEWIDENKKTVKVKDAFAENILLMDLTEQPLSIKQQIKDIHEQVSSRNIKPVNKFTLGVALSEFDLDHIKDDLFNNKFMWIFK
ncbi:MAG: hypothetical protein KDH96_02385 [Candidatus Riesia sp.]|nr:hypothetical protein [Candidatus Riesia sp.]